MSEPRYDEDNVTLGYLKKVVDTTKEIIATDIQKEYANVSKHYATKPQPPYYKGDTWIDGKTIYTCINDRLIGTYVDSDWVTESGAKEEAQSKNKIFLTQPSNYNAGDMWILQTDNDHKSGKRGEMLISIVGRKEYNEDDWINMLGYGTIISINELAQDLNKAIEKVSLTEETVADGIIVVFYKNTIPQTSHVGDLWYVTDNIDVYIKGKVYQYNGENWQELNDIEVTKVLEDANEARLVADEKIQSFYSESEPIEDIGVGDLWVDTANSNKLYRYNGTSWVEVYKTKVVATQEEVDSITKRTAKIETDQGKIQQEVTELTTTVEEVEQDLSAKIELRANEVSTNVSSSVTASIMTALNNGYLTAEQVESLVNGNTEDIAIIKEQLKQTITSSQMQIEITKAIEGGVGYLKNTLFTIDENGMAIATNQDEFNALYNNKGMYLYSFDQMIAQFDVNGATVNNLKVRGSIETKNLKIMDVTVDGVSHAHIHWIGG